MLKWHVIACQGQHSVETYSEYYQHQTHTFEQLLVTHVGSVQGSEDRE